MLTTLAARRPNGQAPQKLIHALPANVRNRLDSLGFVRIHGGRARERERESGVCVLSLG